MKSTALGWLFYQLLRSVCIRCEHIELCQTWPACLSKCFVLIYNSVSGVKVSFLTSYQHFALSDSMIFFMLMSVILCYFTFTSLATGVVKHLSYFYSVIKAAAASGIDSICSASLITF